MEQIDGHLVCRNEIVTHFDKELKMKLPVNMRFEVKFNGDTFLWQEDRIIGSILLSCEHNLKTRLDLLKVFFKQMQKKFSI